MRDITVSKFFYRLRGCAILSVAYAHSLSLSDNSLRQVASLIGIIGVPLFLIASGYFYRKQTSKEFIRSKVNIVVPWLLWGSIAYIITFIAQGGTINIRYIYYMLGYGNWLYYVPIYIIITFIFNYIILRPYLYVCMSITFISCIFTYYFIHSSSIITPYQNPLNWFGFYAIGIYLKSKSLDKWSNNTLGVIFIVGVLLTLTIYLLLSLRMKICYWNPFCVIFELLCIIIVANICSRLKYGVFLEKLGKFSYLIYFLHMQFGIFTVNQIMNLFNFSDTLIFFIKPISVILVTLIYIELLIFIIQLIGLQKFKKYIGIPIK